MAVKRVALREELVERIRLSAQIDDVDRFVDQAVEEQLARLEEDELKKEIAAFERMHTLLMEKYQGEFVALYHGEVVDSDQDFRVLTARIRQRLGDTPVLVRGVATAPTLDAIDLGAALDGEAEIELFSVKDVQLPLDVDEVNRVVRVQGTRVPVDTVIQAFDEGATPEEIVLRFPTLHLADVYLVIGYYLQERAAVDAYLSQRQRFAEQIRNVILLHSDVKGIRERLLARRAANHTEGH